MFVFGNFFYALATVVDAILWAVKWLILIRVLISWVNPDPFNPIVQFLIRTTEPILEPLRRLLPPLGGWDLSPIIAFIIIMFLQPFLVTSLFELGARLKAG